MPHDFINYTLHVADSTWSRRSFLRGWWQIYGNDPRWAPPSFRQLSSLITPERHIHFDRNTAHLIHLDAFRRQRRIGQHDSIADGLSLPGAIFEEPVGAAALISDPRRSDRTAYLALLRTINSEDAMERLFHTLFEYIQQLGCRRAIGPVGLSPFLNTGVLQDYFHLTPPLHTAYNPPYFPELLAQVMQPIRSQRLFRIPTATRIDGWSSPQSAEYTIVSRPIAELSGSLLPLLQVACDDGLFFPLPDEHEAEYLCHIIGAFPSHLRVAERNGTPLGFTLLQADYARLLRRAKGSRNPIRMLALKVGMHRAISDGRIIFGAVAPQFQGQGVGKQLLADALTQARRLGWRSMAIGPLTQTSAAAGFLTGAGAVAQQKYTLYEIEL